MRKNSTIDFLGYTLLKILGPILRYLPPTWVIFLGKVLGNALYFMDGKHRRIANANIRMALGGKVSYARINEILKLSYQRFGQNIFELFLVPLINKEYIEKFVSFDGLCHIEEGFKKNKGVILLACHEGSWELSNILSSNLGFPFAMFVRNQGLPRINNLLNAYRVQNGLRIIRKENETRQVIELLKSNHAIGMTVDQGGKNGLCVEFFGKTASMSTGAVRLALKYDTVIIPVFFTRVKGPYLKVFISPPFEIKKGGVPEDDLSENLTRLISIFEDYIVKYPEEYLWTYKIWKYSKDKKILVLSDGKAGHKMQSEALVSILAQELKDKGLRVETDMLEVNFINKTRRAIFNILSGVMPGFFVPGKLSRINKFLDKGTFDNIINKNADIVVSCGCNLSNLNYLIAYEKLARSIIILRPYFLNVKNFDLVVIPRHDRPPRKDNVLISEGALNLVDQDYLNEHSQRLIKRVYQKSTLDSKKLHIGVLIGGNTKRFFLKEDTIQELLAQLRFFMDKEDAELLLTTSRRTSPKIEWLIKKELMGHPLCKLLVIANENNIPEAVGGILGLCDILVVSPESISMISEAVSSNKHVLVFNAPGLDLRHRRFLHDFAKRGHIFISDAKELSLKIKEIILKGPQVRPLCDRTVVKERIARLI